MAIIRNKSLILLNMALFGTLICFWTSPKRGIQLYTKRTGNFAKVAHTAKLRQSVTSGSAMATSPMSNPGYRKSGSPLATSPMSKPGYRKSGCPLTPLSGSQPGYRKRLPQAILIGVAKAGTGAIKGFLGHSPNVVVAKGDTRFFLNNELFAKGFHYYRSLMPSSDETQVTLERSAGYWLSDETIRRIYDMDPCTKLIVTVIDPAERLVSLFAHFLEREPEILEVNGQKITNFEKYYFNGTHLRTDNPFVLTGGYSKRLQAWLEYFPLNQIHIVDGLRLKKEPWVELMAIEHFLHVPTYLTQAQFYLNETKGFYCLKSHRCLKASKGRKHPYVDPALLQTLRDYYKEDSRQFMTLIARNLSWKFN